MNTIDNHEKEIEYWHAMYKGDASLHEFLGFSFEEYTEMCRPLSDRVIDRIKTAVNEGIKIAVIAEKTGVTYYRMASVVNTKAYRQSTTFTDSEADTINSVLDATKAAL